MGFIVWSFKNQNVKTSNSIKIDRTSKTDLDNIS